MRSHRVRVEAPDVILDPVHKRDVLGATGGVRWEGTISAIIQYDGVGVLVGLASHRLDALEVDHERRIDGGLVRGLAAE